MNYFRLQKSGMDLVKDQSQNCMWPDKKAAEGFFIYLSVVLRWKSAWNLFFKSWV